MRTKYYDNGFDAYADGFRHTFIVLTSASKDGWDVVKYLTDKGFADGTVLTSMRAEDVMRTYYPIIKQATSTNAGTSVIDTVLNNVLFEWNYGYLRPIRYTRGIGQKYLWGHVIRMYMTR